MNITSWLSENRITASVCGFFLLLATALTYLALEAWTDYGSALAEYSQKQEGLKNLATQKPPPLDQTREAVERTLKTCQSDLDALFKRLGKFHVPTFGTIAKSKPSDQPQAFQDLLRKEVTRIKSMSTESRSKLPATFYLGLDSFENRPPTTSEEALALSRQLTVVDWIAETLLSQKDVILEEFLLPQQSPPQKKDIIDKNAPPSGNGRLDKASRTHDTVAEVRMKFRCSQNAFRKFINSLSTAPTFLIIDTLLVQNSSLEPPRRDATPVNVAPPDGSMQSEKLPVIVGRETLSVSMKIRAIEFPDPNSPPPSTEPSK